jgi:hypothetical protein
MDEENEKPIKNEEKSTKAEERASEPNDSKALKMKTEVDAEDKHELSVYDEKHCETVPRRVLRSTSAQSRLAELGS